MRRNIILTVAGLVFLAIFSWLTVKTAIAILADRKAEEILSETSGKTDIDTSLGTARYMLGHFHRDGFAQYGAVMKLRPYLENERLPALFRFPSGAIETLAFEGWCDNASRSMLYILSKRNIDGVQWNMAGLDSAHAAPLIKTAEGPMLVDPYYGIATIQDGKPIDPKDATIASFQPLGPQTDAAFYKNFTRISMAAQGTPLTLTATLPKLHGKPLSLGKLNGQSDDTRSGGLTHGLGAYWDYIGHRFDRSWVRVLTAPEAMQVEMILTTPPEKRVLRTLTPRPTVEGDKLVWTLAPGGQIMSKDGLAGISWRRMNSYIGIDQIILTPQGDRP